VPKRRETRGESKGGIMSGSDVGLVLFAVLARGLLFLVGIGIVGTLGAVFLRVAAKLVAKFSPPFGTAFKASLFVFLVFWLGLMVGELISENLAAPWKYLVALLVLALCVPIYATVVRGRIQHPETGPLTFGKAFLVSLVQVFLLVAFFAVFSLLASVAVSIFA